MSPATDRDVTAAFAVCRQIAKREAKNFYYSFRVLPAAKSDAMCAIYAFMRKADDLADDESLPVSTRREAMATWLNEWRLARATGASNDPVFLAVSATQKRFDISDALLEQLVDGTTMDLAEHVPGVVSVRLEADAHERTVQAYETFADLYRYCYLVASVVGLVCIKIFGYTDPAAELLAEKTGIAFQLTNILRDVKEDAERGRIYLPQEMLREYNVSNEALLGLAHGAALRANDRALLVGLSVQAWEYYQAAWQLLPLIDADSRAALWVLVRIYSGLLGKIDEKQGDVFSARVSVPAAQKMFVLLRGAAMSVRNRS